ncbi:DUF2946 family protein [Erwinia sp. V71]|uniref:DUF2946 family protein n=1 Tax=Erwinia sp. V71 TaxID=3369424 RepID=UPI003F5FBDF0
MVTLFRLSQHRIPAVIAIMAIMLLFIAPEVSKSLALRHDVSNRATTHTSTPQRPVMVMAGMDHSAMDHRAMHAEPAAHSLSATRETPDSHHSAAGAMPAGMSMMDDIACGYCLFLLHFPLLLWVFVPLILQMLLSSRAAPCPQIILFTATLFTGLCQPRAPPAY